MNYSAKDILLLLLNVHNKKPIKEHYKMVLEMFLIYKEIYEPLQMELNFIVDKYKISSYRLNRIIHDLIDNDLITCNCNEYSITEKGLIKLDTVGFDGDLVRKIINTKIVCDVWDFKKLFRYVFFNYM